MRRSLSVRIAMLVLVASMAVPVMAAPRDDSPIDRVERVISRFVQQITHIFDLSNDITIPK
jgi:hypothetical protein